MGMNPRPCMRWVKYRLEEAIIVVFAFAGLFSYFRNLQRKAMEEKKVRKGPLPPSKKERSRDFLRAYHRDKNRGVTASVPLWLASVDDPLGTREEVIDFLVNGPKRYRRFRRRFTGLMLDLYTMAAETAPKDSTEGTVLNAFVQRLKTVQASQFPE